MAHWFHRNPLKATSPVTFDLRGVATNGNAQKICRDLQIARRKLLELLTNPSNEIETMTSAASEYLSLFHGFLVSLDENAAGKSKLRNVVRFRWTNTLCGNTPIEQYDAVFEQASMVFNIALWYTKHAAQMASKEEPSMEEAKEVHKSLRTAAGAFCFIKESLAGQLEEQAEKGTDLEARVLDGYIHQCTAEAQEVTIARAIELKHSASIVSSLAYETAEMFQSADDALSTLDPKSVEKWRKYLQFKIGIYYAYAYNYHGENLLAQDKCGEAIKCLQESEKNLDKALEMGRDYASTKGPGSTAKPHEHLFFRKLGPVVKRTLEKCVRENGFIYHQKVPAEAPKLELKATYGLVKPEEFAMPSPSPLWIADTYNAFDTAKAPTVKKDSEKSKDGDIPPVKEGDISGSGKDPKTFSGCTVS